MDEKKNIQKYLQNYIKENRDTYTADVIRLKLLEAGYDRHEIREAFKALGMAGSSKVIIEGDWRSAPVNPFGFLIFFPVLPLFGYILSVIFNDISWFGLVYFSTLIAGFIAPIYVKRRNPSMAKGMIYGFRTFLLVFVCLPIVAGLVIFGICIASMSNY